MNKKQGTFLALIILILLILGVYTIVSNNKKIDKEITSREQAIEEEAKRPEKTINLKHQYKDGTHVFSGTIEVPTPCYELSAVILPGNPAELQIKTKELQTSNVCAEVITELPYKVSRKGPEELSFLATVDNEPVNLNQFEIPADQDFDSVEIFIKG